MPGARFRVTNTPRNDTAKYSNFCAAAAERDAAPSMHPSLTKWTGFSRAPVRNRCHANARNPILASAATVRTGVAIADHSSSLMTRYSNSRWRRSTSLAAMKRLPSATCKFCSTRFAASIRSGRSIPPLSRRCWATKPQKHMRATYWNICAPSVRRPTAHAAASRITTGALARRPTAQAVACRAMCPAAASPVSTAALSAACAKPSSNGAGSIASTYAKYARLAPVPDDEILIVGCNFGDRPGQHQVPRQRGWSKPDDSRRRPGATIASPSLSPREPAVASGLKCRRRRFPFAAGFSNCGQQAASRRDLKALLPRLSASTSRAMFPASARWNLASRCASAGIPARRITYGSK